MMKPKHKIVIAIFLVGLLLSFLAYRQHKKLLNLAVEPYNKEIRDIKDKNEALLSKIKKDSLETLKMIQENNRIVEEYNEKLDSIIKAKQKNEKAIIEYGGDFNSRFRQFTDNLTNSN